MSYYIRLKGITLGGLVGLFTLVHFLSTSTTTVYPTNTDRPPLSIAVTKIAMPTSDAVPLPTCRYRYIDFSSDTNYPIPHWIYSLPHSADKALVLAIARTESQFKPYARSEKGALGLMQLMPDTANYMVKKQRLAGVILASASATNNNAPSYVPRNPFDFRDPYVSFAVGHRYIRYLQEKPYIGDSLVYTLTAYNAGPQNLLKWKREFGRLTPDAFAAKIPYRETREYVQKVMRDYARYQTLLPTIRDVVWTEDDKC